MRDFSNYCVELLVIVLSLAASATGQEVVEVTFQDGLNGYTGTEDTYLRGQYAPDPCICLTEYNYGGSNVMRASFYAALAAKLTQRPLVWHVRDIHPLSERWYTRLMCRRSAKVIAISQAVAAALPCPSKVAVVYNGLDLSEYHAEIDPAMARTQLGPACDTGLVAPPPDELAAEIGEWVDLFERMHLMLRLSPHLRERHGD